MVILIWFLKYAWAINECSIHKLKVYSKVGSILRGFFMCIYLFLVTKKVNLVSESRKGTVLKI